MFFNFRGALVLGAVLLGACGRSTQEPTPVAATQAETVRRFAAILDYVAADYPGAVTDGKVASPEEYAEQLAFMKDAEALVGKLPAMGAVDARAGVARVHALVDAKASGPDVATACRALRRQVLDATGVVLAPLVAPSRERGATLYAQNCAACHGATGAGDGERAASLTPKPRSFRDPEVVIDLSPARAFSALTDGIDGTAMASFGALSPSERWSLSFHVVALRHDAAAVERGRVVFGKARHVAASPTRLAEASDRDLDGTLASAGLDAPARADAIAFLRAEASFVTQGAAMSDARRLLGEALAAARAGERGRARQLAGSAYLDGLEPHEGALMSRDPQLVTRLEERFLRLREALSSSAELAPIEAEALVLSGLLDRADEALSSRGGNLALIGALLVVLREGLEAALLIMLLLALTRRAGAGDDVRAVHAGWLGAAGLGVITWFASGPLVALGGARRELMEGLVALLAAAMLLFAGHWVIARMDAKRRVDELKRKIAAIAPARRYWTLAGLAFVAVYREAFEVVLFLRAIALDAGARAGQVAVGAGLGAVACVAVVWILGRASRKLKPGPLLAASGTLLCALAVVLAGKGMRALQEAGTLPITPLPLPRVAWLGFFPTWQTVLTQAGVLGVFFAIALLALRGRTSGTAANDAPAPPSSATPTA